MLVVCTSYENVWIKENVLKGYNYGDKEIFGWFGWGLRMKERGRTSQQKGCDTDESSPARLSQFL